MMNEKSHFGTLRYLGYLCRSLLEQQIELVLKFLFSYVYSKSTGQTT